MPARTRVARFGHFKNTFLTKTHKLKIEVSLASHYKMLPKFKQKNILILIQIYLKPEKYDSIEKVNIRVILG